MEFGQIRPYRPNGLLQAAGHARTRTFSELRAEQHLVDRLESSFDSRAFVELWQREALTLEDLTDERTLVAWRLVRFIARMRGLCADDQFLHEATAVSPDPWTCAVGIVANAPLLRARRTEEIPASPLLPPDVPEDWCDGDGVRVGYLPTEDRALVTWIDFAESCAKQLTIGYRQIDLYAAHPIFNPYLCRASFPAPESLMLQESTVVEAAVDLYLEHGTQGTVDKLRIKFGLTQMESLSVLRLVGRVADSRVSKNDDHNYALMCLRLESVAARARGLMDLRAELAALKNLAIIQGLTSAGTDDEVKDVNSTVREISSRRAAMLANRTEAS